VNRVDIQNIVNLRKKLPPSYFLNSSSNNKQKSFYISTNLKIKKYRNKVFEKKFSQILKNSICFNIALLHLYTRYKLRLIKYLYHTHKCINLYFNKKKNFLKKCTRLPQSLKYLFENARNYFHYHNKILSQVIIPEIFEMCYIKCLCADYNITCDNKNIDKLMDENAIIYTINKLMPGEHIDFLIKLHNFFEGVKNLNYQQVAQKCSSVPFLLSFINKIHNDEDFLSRYTKTYQEWTQFNKNFLNYKGSFYNIGQKIEQLKTSFNKKKLAKELLTIISDDKDVVCKFLISTRLFSTIGYENIFDITYSHISEKIINPREKEDFSSFVIYKTILLKNTITFNKKDIKFFDFSFNISSNFKNISALINTFSEWLYGRTTSPLFNHFAGFLTFFDYYLFLLEKDYILKIYSGQKKNLLHQCLLQNKEFLYCMSLNLDKETKKYWPLLKKFFNEKKIKKITPLNLYKVIKKLNPPGAGKKLYESFKDAKNCCEKSEEKSKHDFNCGTINEICDIKYESLTYIRKIGEKRLEEILGTALFKFLQKIATKN
ncbi:MAG: hypothetical protein ACK4NF_07125, partial [Planctomycetota bacterium]